MGDFGQLLQLADNLIGNAIRYGCNDKSCAVDGVGRSATEQASVLTVSDQGEGIAAEHLPRLTERFYRVEFGAQPGIGRHRAWAWQSSSISSSAIAARSKSDPSPARAREVTVSFPAPNNRAAVTKL